MGNFLFLSVGATFGLLPKKRENVKRKNRTLQLKAWQTPPSSSDNGLHIPDVIQIPCHVDII